MKLPEPHRILQGFGMEPEYLYTKEQMREALASHEAVMWMAMQALEECAGLTSMDAQRRVAAIRALEEALK